MNKDDYSEYRFFKLPLFAKLEIAKKFQLSERINYREFRLAKKQLGQALVKEIAKHWKQYTKGMRQSFNWAGEGRDKPFRRRKKVAPPVVEKEEE